MEEIIEIILGSDNNKNSIIITFCLAVVDLSEILYVLNVMSAVNAMVENYGT